MNNNSQEISEKNTLKNFSKEKNLSNNKKKRNKKNKNEKSKHNIDSKSKDFSILSEIKQITIPEVLDEKEKLYKILQSEIVSIDKGIDLLNKKKKYYDEIIHKLIDEIQNEKKSMKKIENKNKEYLYMENLLKDIDINATFETNFSEDNSYYNKNKVINEIFDYNYFLLNQKNNKNFLLINFFSEKNKSKINNKMEPNFQMTYEEFNNIDEMDNNYCLLMNEEIKKINSENKKEEEKIIIDSEPEENNNSINIINNTPLRTNQSNEIKEEFTIINEAPAEEEDTNNKKRIKLSMNEIDENIKKDYSNSVEELDFYLLKNSNKKNIDEIQKKYKVQDMGSDFLPSETSSLNNSREIKKKKKKKKKLSNINSNNEESNNSNIIISNDDNSDDINNKEKKKKKGRKKKNKDVSITFSINEDYPDPENLDNTALSLEMKKYGMKPQNKKKNIEILKSVYNFLKIKEMPQPILKELTKFDCDNNENASDNDNESDNYIASKKNENKELNDDKKRKIIEIIKENKNIYEKILLFKEVSIKDIKNILKTKGIIVPNHALSTFLIDSGVVLPGGWNHKK